MIELIRKHQHSIVELCRKYGVTRLELFGSAARGDFVEGASDVDLLYDIDPSPLQGLADRYFRFQEELEALLGCPVDLVSAKDASNPYFLASANQNRVLLYAA